MRKNYNSNKGQGVAKYLLIIAVVMIISLVVVNLMSAQTEIVASISSNTQKTSQLGGSIAVVNSFEDENANDLAFFDNNSNDGLTIMNIADLQTGHKLGK